MIQRTAAAFIPVADGSESQRVGERELFAFPDVAGGLQFLVATSQPRACGFLLGQHQLLEDSR